MLRDIIFLNYRKVAQIIIDFYNIIIYLLQKNTHNTLHGLTHGHIIIKKQKN